MRISIIANTLDPDAVHALRQGVARLRQEGHEVRAQLTFESGDARRMARAAAERATELLIVAGGDGTLNEVVNGIHDHLAARPDASHPPPSGPRLGIVPLGTANDFAAALELPEEIPAALHTAVNGRTLEIDIGLAGERCFLNVSTGGFGAEASEGAPSEVKRVIGPLAYVIAGARELAALEISEARFVADETIYEGPFLLFAVGNSRRTGGGNHLTPRAELTDGLLDLCVVREVSRMEFVALLPQLRAGEHLDHPAVIYRQVPHVTVEAGRELNVNADGEPLSGHRFEYRVSPHRLSLMVP